MIRDVLNRGMESIVVRDEEIIQLGLSKICWSSEVHYFDGPVNYNKDFQREGTT